MIRPIGPLLSSLTRAEVLPALGMIAYVVALFAIGTLIAQEFAIPIRASISAYPRLGVLVFIGTAIVAVLVPVLTNLPLVPIAVLTWGPLPTALFLLAGWVVGSAVSFVLGRHASALLLRRFPSVYRHATIERLIDPQHRISSLVMLRMTFPVDVLSYALGLFSRSTTLSETTMSTALGGAPFALLFSLYPTLPVTAQLIVFTISALAFVAYTLWMLKREPTDSPH